MGDLDACVRQHSPPHHWIEYLSGGKKIEPFYQYNSRDLSNLSMCTGAVLEACDGPHFTKAFSCCFSSFNFSLMCSIYHIHMIPRTQLDVYYELKMPKRMWSTLNHCYWPMMILLDRWTDSWRVRVCVCAHKWKKKKGIKSLLNHSGCRLSISQTDDWQQKIKGKHKTE